MVITNGLQHTKMSRNVVFADTTVITSVLYKVVESLVDGPTSCHPVPRPKPHVTSRNFRQSVTLNPEVDAYKSAFLGRTIAAWSSLPDRFVHAESVDVFRRCEDHDTRLITSVNSSKRKEQDRSNPETFRPLASSSRSRQI